MNKYINFLYIIVVTVSMVSCDTHEPVFENFPVNESFVVPIRICDALGRNLINDGRVKPEDVYATAELTETSVQTFRCRTDVTSHHDNDRVFHGLFIMQDTDGEYYLCLGCFNSENPAPDKFVLHWSDGSENTIEIYSILEQVSDGGRAHIIYWFISDNIIGGDFCTGRDKYSSEIMKTTY